AFYDVQVPLDPAAHPRMHSVLLVAVFGFCVTLALAVAARRAVAAVLVLVVGAGWPATLLTGENELLRGAVVLGAALVLLAGLAAGWGGSHEPPPGGIRCCRPRRSRASTWRGRT